MLEALARIRREVSAIRGVETVAHSHLRDRLVSLAIISVLVDAFATVVFWLLERNEPGTGVHGIGDALFFVSTQMLSIGSALPNPITTPGRIVDVGLELYAITAGAALAGAFGSFFIHRSRDRQAAAEAAT
jgi:hypothetical protein